jgi:hypothetical protein
MSNINVEPKDIITTQTCTSANITIMRLEFGKSAVFNVMLFDNNRQLIKAESIEVSGDDYNAWSNDDSYIVSFILAKYGLTPASN